MGTRRTVYFSDETDGQMRQILDMLGEQHYPIKVSLSQAVALTVAEYHRSVLGAYLIEQGLPPDGILPDND